MTANAQRVNELMNSMKAFGRGKYHKSEMLDEMLKLQAEMVHLTYNGKHAATADLKIYDVVKHLEQMNNDCGNVADKELRKFQTGANELSNLIRVEICGAKGENKVFHTLQYVRSGNRVLKNIELSDGNLRTEVDAAVVLPGIVVIIEVKNTSKNIQIDVEGNYYRVGEHTVWDCNIAEKLTTKELLIKRALAAGGYQNIPVKSVVVFTNNKIRVQNESQSISKCYVNQLPRMLDDMSREAPFSDTEMDEIATVIQNAECPESYCCEMDVEQFKKEFAELMAILEEASAMPSEIAEQKIVEATTSETSDNDGKAKEANFKAVGYLGTALASAVLTLLLTAAAKALKGGR